MIPKIHHTVWCTDSHLQSRFYAYRQSWMRYNPDWTFYYWDLSNLPYDKLPAEICKLVRHPDAHYVLKTEVRWEILHLFGGVYSDCDVECLAPFGAFMVHDAFAGVSYPPNGIGNAVVGCKPGYPLMREIASATANAILKDVVVANKNPPDVSVNVAGKLLEKIPVKYPQHIFYPTWWGHDAERRYCNSDLHDSYTNHHWTGVDKGGWVDETIRKPKCI